MQKSYISMRTLFLPLLALPFTLFAGQPATISGKPSPASEAVVEFRVDSPYPADTAKQSFKLNADFQWQLDLEKGKLVEVTFGNENLQLYMEPGDALTLSINPSAKPLAIEFSGKGAENNRMLYDFNNKFSADFNSANVTVAIEAAPSVDELESSLFEQRLKHMKFMKEHSAKGAITAGFRDFLNNQVSYHYFGHLLLYSIQKSGDPTGMKASKLPDIMLGEMNSLPLMDERNMNSREYREFLSSYIRYRTAEVNNFMRFFDYADMMDKEYNYALRYLSGEPFKYWLGSELYNYCDKATPETVQRLYLALIQTDTKQGAYAKSVYAKCQQEITAKIEKKENPEEDTKEKKSKETTKKSDQPFTLIDLKGNKVYLDDFKGKVIYVDFWASWCGPCRQQFPYAKELKNMLTPDQLKNVVFLYVSIDDTEEKWKKAVEQHQIEGFHTNSPGGWGSSVTQHFGVNSIPRYMLIDKKGNIADSNAKRPSSVQEILYDILKLLAQ